MNNEFYLKAGKLFFAIAVLAFGIIILVTGTFPVGLMPVSTTLPGHTILAYLTGVAFLNAGGLLLINKYTHAGAFFAFIIFTLLLLLVHVPKIAGNIKDGSEWTGVFENVALISGTLIIAGVAAGGKYSHLLLITGRYIFALCLLVFGILHFVYFDFISVLIPSWLPLNKFWGYLVMIAFFAAAISIIIQQQMRLAASLIGLMFFIWVLILHLPRSLSKMTVEPEWTSLFVALAMSGIALAIAGSTFNKTREARLAAI